MGHELTCVRVDGAEHYSCVTVREPAWHSLGVNFTERDGLTVDEALHASHQDFIVRKVAVRTHGDEIAPAIDVPDTFASVREHPLTGETNVLGIVSGRYTILQNRSAFELGQHLVDDYGANIVSAGGLFDDRRTFVTLRLPEDLTIGDDAYKCFLTLLNSHDGSTALSAAVTPVRVVCANTARAALRRARHQWTARHTSGLTTRVDEARRTLHLARQHTAALRDTGEQLLAQHFTPDEFDRMVRALMPLDDDATERRASRIRAAHENLHRLFTEAPTQDSIRGTRWAALQAVTEFADWGPLRGDDPGNRRRATRLLTEQPTPLKLAATDYLLAA